MCSFSQSVDRGARFATWRWEPIVSEHTVSRRARPWAPLRESKSRQSLTWLEKSFAGLHCQFLVFRLQLQFVIAVRLGVWGRRVAEFVLQPQVIGNLREDVSQAHRAGDSKYPPTRTI